ncbi:MAG: cytochrome c [Flavobacteriales bacterium]|nr:cytochrome c [Flavobacteriales bacterium]
MTRSLLFSIVLLVFACGSANSSNDTMEADRSSGRAVYNMNCALCHGRDGRAGINGAKDLTASTLTKEEMQAIVRNGRGVMAPYKNVLTAKEIDAVVEHVRTLGKAK